YAKEIDIALRRVHGSPASDAPGIASILTGLYCHIQDRVERSLVLESHIAQDLFEPRISTQRVEPRIGLDVWKADRPVFYRLLEEGDRLVSLAQRRVGRRKLIRANVPLARQRLEPGEGALRLVAPSGARVDAGERCQIERTAVARPFRGRLQHLPGLP